MSCIFCAIGQGSIPAEKLYDNEAVFVIADIHPKAKVHLLVIPKQHIVTFNDFTPVTYGSMASVAEAIANVTQQLGIAKSGYKVIANNGSDGGQAVPHLHFHILGGEPVQGIT